MGKRDSDVIVEVMNKLEPKSIINIFQYHYQLKL